MDSFEFFFGLVLGDILLRHTGNLSRTLQNKKYSAAEGQAVVQMTVKAIQSTRSDAKYNLFWEKVTKMANDLDVDEPKLPRKRKVPRRYDTGEAEAEFHSSLVSLFSWRQKTTDKDLVNARCLCFSRALLVKNGVRNIIISTCTCTKLIFGNCFFCYRISPKIRHPFTKGLSGLYDTSIKNNTKLLVSRDSNHSAKKYTNKGSYSRDNVHPYILFHRNPVTRNIRHTCRDAHCPYYTCSYPCLYTFWHCDYHPYLFLQFLILILLL